MLKMLSFIGDQLNNQNITWAVGGSLLLRFYKIIDKPNDIDILVSESDVPLLNQIMRSIGEPQETLSGGRFRTAHFSKYKINGIQVDVMGGFAIHHEKGMYRCSLQRESVVAHKSVNGINIPLCSLEDWYILYWLIPNKHEKALLIENYLRTNGIAHPQLLKAALKQPLPPEAKDRVEKLLSDSHFADEERT